MHDGIEIEKRGLPAIVVCTEEFVTTGKAIAEMRGAADYPLIIVPHPIATWSAETTEKRAKKTIPEVYNLLTVEQ